MYIDTQKTQMYAYNICRIRVLIFGS